VLFLSIYNKRVLTNPIIICLSDPSELEAFFNVICAEKAHSVRLLRLLSHCEQQWKIHMCFVWGSRGWGFESLRTSKITIMCNTPPTKISWFMTAGSKIYVYYRAKDGIVCHSQYSI